MKNFFERFHSYKLKIVLSFCVLCQVTSSAFLSGHTIDTNPQNVIWEFRLADFSSQQYDKAVHHLFTTFENTFSRKLAPGERGKVGLKIYTGSGVGLSTPKPLVLAVIKELQSRGFDRNDIFILDETAFNLRCSGFLPELSQGGDTFEGIPVFPLDKNTYWDDEWFYTTALPSRFSFAQFLSRGTFRRDLSENSYLPVPLILDADFWINLPMVTSQETTPVCGALANATIFNVSNNKRFIVNRIHGALALAEIAAIPEIQETWAFTLLTLERYQFIGGSIFNFRYTKTEPILWLSMNAPAMDYLMFQRINRARHQEGLKTFKALPDFFEYSKSLNVGDYEDIRIVRLQNQY